MNTNSENHITFQGFYKIGYYNPTTKEEVWHEEGKNLILNQGMDQVYGSAIVDLMLYGIAGVGTRPNSINSGTSAITQSGATVYLSTRTGTVLDFTSSTSGYTATAQLGDMLVYQNNSQSTITNVYGDGFNLQVSPSYTFSNSQSFTIWKTSQTSLQSEKSRSIAYIAGAGFCGTTTSGNTATHRRTFDFAVEPQSATYNEAGISWASSGPNTTFSRILLGSPLTINQGFKLRIIYDLVTTWAPASASYATASIGGWPVSPSVNTIGSQSIQNFVISTINTSGNSNTTVAALDPYYITAGGYTLGIWASPDSTPLANFGSAVNRTTNAGASSGTMTKASYTAGTYFLDKTGILAVGTSNRTDLRTIGLGYSGGGTQPYDGTGQVFTFLFNQPQTKTSIQTLSLTFRYSWDRVLA